jgi:diguanylate cyclase (GGDEF)-like protein
MNTKSNKVNDVLKLPLYPTFMSDLSALLAGLDPADSPCVTLVMYDVDRLLELNSKFGYEALDHAMIDTALHFMSGLPEAAKMYRYSGDCFVVVMPAVEKEDAFLLMERLRREMAVTLPDGSAFTVSMGIASAPEDGTAFSEFVRKADGAMYRAKQTGRNKICLAREEKMVTKTSHYTVGQLQKLTELSKKIGIGEAVLLREALDVLLQKYDVMRHDGQMTK